MPTSVHFKINKDNHKIQNMNKPVMKILFFSHGVKIKQDISCLEEPTENNHFSICGFADFTFFKIDKNL